jgi:cGMP-dependent protein kinase
MKFDLVGVMQQLKLIHGLNILSGYLLTNIKKDKLMDRELKPPFVPPNDKIINDKEIQKKELLAKSVVEEIKVKLYFFNIIKNDGIKEQKDIIYHPEKAKDQNWDKEF